MSRLTRRDFLKLAVLGAGALAFRPFAHLTLPEFPQANKLGRVTVGKVDVYSRPDADSSVVNVSPDDAKWIFRWSQPQVMIDPGDVTVEWPGGTKVKVQDR